jgi:hypothetical protein
MLHSIDSDFKFECVSEVLSMSSWLNFMPDSRHSDLDSVQMSFAALKTLIMSITSSVQMSFTALKAHIMNITSADNGYTVLISSLNVFLRY